jgi:hypothetical protein
MIKALALLVAVVVPGWWLPARASALVDQLIRSNCMRAVQAEVEASGEPSPAGMTESICDCVVEEFNKGRSIDQAIATCKEAAIRKYGL